MKITEKKLRKLVQQALQENLWDNIRKKRARGEKPAKPGQKGYPDEKSWRSATGESEEEEETLTEKSKGLWANIHAKKKRGEKSNPRSKEYQAAKKAGQKINRDAKKNEADYLDEYGDMNEALDYHLDAGVGVDMNVFRPGSTAFFALFREARRRFYEGAYEPISIEEFELLEDLDIGEFAIYEGQLVPLDYPIMEGNEEHLNEAEYKGKKVELNKPKRGGEGGKAYVYVNSGKKTKDGKIKVKKVPFGSSMPDAMGDSDAHKKRRKSFGDRHNCADKKDKTKPGYWSCRATKFFGRDIAGWW